MTSILKVSEIQDPTNSNTALTIDSAGDVTIAGVEIDLYRLTADFSSNTVMTGWERPDDGHFAKLGTGMSESSGIFTFPSTGLWRVDGNWSMSCASNDALVLYVRLSQDSGSTYDDISLAVDSNGEGCASTTNIINVTNASTFKLQFLAQSISSGSAFNGRSEFNETHVVFHRIAPAQ